MGGAIFHGKGGNNSVPFSIGSGGGVVGNPFKTLVWTSPEDFFFAGIPIPAPDNFLWDEDNQGYYLQEEHVLREIHFLFNEFVTSVAGMTITVRLKRQLADGTSPLPVTVLSNVTTFPDTSLLSRYFFGDFQNNLNIVIPAGFHLYCEVSAISAFTVIGASIWALFEKV